MTVFFTCSTRHILKYREYYQEARKSILSLGHTINRDWLEEALAEAEKNKDSELSSVYQNVMSSIVTADLIIADTTVSSMSIGHQITFALQKRKPVLLMHYLAGGDELRDIFIVGAKSPLLSMKGYETTAEIRDIVKDFVNKFGTASKTRFNLVLNKAQDSYIEWASFQTKKSKTEIIQDAINEKMHGDKLFEKYLDE